MKAILVSRRFHPGHISHIEANSKLLRANGCDVRFSLHERFFTFPGSSFKKWKAGISDYLQLRAGDLLVVWFPSLSGLANMLLVRLINSATVVYIYHEPYTSFASYREGGFSSMKALKVTAISVVNSLLCLMSHKIILPSARAYQALPAASTNPLRYAKINLLFSDEACSDHNHYPRSFISYIGTIAEDHAFEEFVRLMQSSIPDRSLLSYKFLIATSSVIPPNLSAAIEYAISSGRLMIHSGSHMTNNQINAFYAQSFVVWNAYRRSMQSGVLPKAYMFGTPVLVSTCNESEYFKDGIHGTLISDRYAAEDFQQAISRLERSWTEISKNCRNYYLQNFDYRALSSLFMNFVSEKNHD